MGQRGAAVRRRSINTGEPFMKRIITSCLALLALQAAADEQRVYRVDPYGNVTYGEPSFSVGGDGRIVQVDRHGNEQPGKSQYVTKGERIYESDSYGRVRFDRPSYTVERDGRVVETDRHGNKRYDKPQYKVEGHKIYEVDAFGAKRQKFTIESKQKK